MFSDSFIGCIDPADRQAEAVVGEREYEKEMIVLLHCYKYT